MITFVSLLVTWGDTSVEGGDVPQQPELESHSTDPAAQQPVPEIEAHSSEPAAQQPVPEIEAHSSEPAAQQPVAELGAHSTEPAEATQAVESPTQSNIAGKPDKRGKRISMLSCYTLRVGWKV